jgi:hypothetical protein
VDALRGNDGFTLAARNQTFSVIYRQGGTFLDRISGNNRLRVGDRVKVTGELTESGRILAEDVDVISRVRPSGVLEGSIRVMSLNDRRFGLLTPGGLVRINFDEGTEFYRNRGSASARDFRSGDNVRVVARKRGDGEYIARRVIMGGDAGWENNAVGEIVELSLRNQTAEVDFDGRIETVDLRNANIRRRDRKLDIDDLRLGQDIRVQGTRPARGSINATNVEVLRNSDSDRGDAGELRTVEGRIDEVIDANLLRVDQDNGGNIRVVLNGDTRIVRGANDVNRSSLRRDQRVRIRGRVVRSEGGRDQIEALRIEILP